LATLPDGKVPLFLQEGHSDFESLAWLQLMLTEQVARNAQPDFSNSLTPASIVMTGSDGNGWHLVPLHALKDRHEIPDVCLPQEESWLTLSGNLPIPCGRWTKCRDEFAMGWQFKGEGFFDALSFLNRPLEQSVLPLRLRKKMLPVDLQEQISSDLWVVEQRDIFTHEGKHEIELLTCADPVRFIGPAVPAGSKRPGGLYRVRVNRVPEDVPDWAVESQFLNFSSPQDVLVKLSTPYAATESIGGLHLVPEVGTELLVAWDGSLGDFPTMVTAPRPIIDSVQDQNGVADVRDLGPVAFEPARDRNLAICIPKGTMSVDFPEGSGGTLETFADKDVILGSFNGTIMLQRDAGRVFQIGQEYVDIDPVGAPPAISRTRRKRSKKASSGNSSHASHSLSSDSKQSNKLESNRESTYFDLRPDADKYLSKSPFAGKETHALRIWARKSRVAIKNFDPGHIWIEWTTVSTGNLATKFVYGYYGDGSSTCLFKCNGQLQNDLNAITAGKGLKHAVFFVSKGQYNTALETAESIGRRSQNKTNQYGIIWVTENAFSCRGLVKRVFDAIGKDVPSPGRDLPTSYLARLMKFYSAVRRPEEEK
jgi:hypothetical protein